jgi:hypothetical protein
MKLQYTFTRQFLLQGLAPEPPLGPACPQTPQRGYPPSALPRVEECTYLWGVNTSWGINMTESKRPLNQEDNQAIWDLPHWIHLVALIVVIHFTHNPFYVWSHPPLFVFPSHHGPYQ